MSGLFICSSALTTVFCSVLLSVASSAIHMLELFFLITLQDTIDTVTVEGVENVEGEEHIEIKTEEDYIQLVRTVKIEQEVSVLCWFVCVCVYACVLYCTHCI